MARLRAAQRSVPPSAPAEVFRSGALEVNLIARTVRVNETSVRLSVTEYALLCLLVKHAGKVLTHGQILREVWGTSDPEKTGSLRVYVAYLREKLESIPAVPVLIVTEPGIGYRLVTQD
jgi:two-component system KDP operon response regulator KdpE